METISELLGHASSSFTHATYAHPSRETQKPALTAISSLTVDISRRILRLKNMHFVRRETNVRQNRVGGYSLFE
jgi:hypothetical protein